MTDLADERIRTAIERSARVVQGVPDPEQKRIAFQVVLTHLLGSAPEPNTFSNKPAVARPIAKPAPGREISRNGPSNWVLALIGEGYFQKPRIIGDVVNRLAEVGHKVLSKDVSFPLARFCELRQLRRTRTGKDTKGRSVWVYTNY